jgi:predicted N-formylglutamate amidohydrolase
VLESLPDVYDVVVVRGAHAVKGAPPDLLVEVPHGATRTADFEALGALLSSPLPPALVDFFHVNTDAGAPELAEAVARRFVEVEPARSAVVLCARVPRTFVDCNRRIDATREELLEGRVTPGLGPWITAPQDRALLLERHAAYRAAVGAALDGLAPEGAMLILHTYAPRSVDVEVGLDIGERMRHAWAPDVVSTWPLRPALDVIARTVDGVSYAPLAVVEALRDRLGPQELEVADGATYPLHPSTLGFEHVTRRPGRCLCLEVRRDLLADPFEPFAQMTIGASQVARLAEPLAQALRRFW